MKNKRKINIMLECKAGITLSCSIDDDMEEKVKLSGYTVSSSQELIK
jgi:hypothetical protein